MNALTELTKEYLQYCHVRKGLSPKTLRAYRTDLEDFRRYMEKNNVDFLVSHHIGEYIDTLHCSKAPRTVKRKIASIQAFYQYLVYTDKIAEKTGFIFQASPEAPTLYSKPHHERLLPGIIFAEEPDGHSLPAQMRNP